MTADSKVLHTMLLRIAEFFRFISDNEENRLYYVLPIQRKSPYAYQHSSIRDVATICDILDLVKFFNVRKMALPDDSLLLFEKAAKNTLQAYHTLYQKDDLPNLPEGNIGDIGFFLLALQKCFRVFPSQLPDDWQETKTRLILRLLERQNPDGSIAIFFDNRLKSYEKSAEAFYLPEALIGLMACLESNPQVAPQVLKAVAYCCQEKLREQNLESDSATFYANWQFQLLYHALQNKLGDAQVTTHLEKIVGALMVSRIAEKPFGNDVATVEVACYMEGLVHAQRSLEMLHLSDDDEWFEKEIDRSLRFLYEIQTENLLTVHGGFVHSRFSNEARLDVAGHVFSGLQLIILDSAVRNGQEH
jgi:hypothetical protein